MLKMDIKRKLKNQAKRGLFNAFEYGQRFGIDVLPRHFYSQIPDLRALRSDDSWKKPRDMSSVKGHEIESQIALASDVCLPLGRELDSHGIYKRACTRNGEPGYGGHVDAAFLYAFVRRNKPRKVVQVGCGVSTAVMLLAAKHAGYELEIVCIDPFPTEFLRQAHAGGEIVLIEGPAQKWVASEASGLSDGDMLFVDSTHAVMPGSEVNGIVLDVMPGLAKGVFVHFHDVYFPYDYQRGLLNGELFHSSETALLHAFLRCNESYRILASLAMLHFGAKEHLRSLIRTYEPAKDDHGLEDGPGDFPSALYMVRG